MIRIELKVITRSKKETLEKVSHGRYRIKVACPPEKQKANKRIIELVSEEFGVRKSAISIVSGATSNHKIIEINT